MGDTEYRYAIEYLDDDGERIDVVSVEPDWLPAREWAHFQAVRRGKRLASADPGAACIEPVFDDDVGAPVVGAARVTLPAMNGNAVIREDIPSPAYFRAAARTGSAELVERGVLETGDPYRFRVCAWLAEATPDIEEASGLGLMLEAAPEPIEIDTRSLEEFRIRSSAASAPEDGGMPVFVPRHLLAMAESRARDAGKRESGGMLVGKLHRDPDVPEVFLEITALIPAAHAEAERTSLTFKPETWQALRSAMALRDAGEVLCGWQHAHPEFCAACPPEARRACAYARPFFSDEDVHMHRTIFANAFQVALLSSDLGEEALDQSLFGWNRGVVAPRSFYIVD